MDIVTGSNGFLGKHLVARLQSPICIPHGDIKFYELPQYDSLYFLSAYGNLSTQTDDKATIQANLVDPITLAFQRKDFKSFVYISTSSVKLNIQTMYSRTKKACEEVLMGYCDKYKLPICIVRPFSVTGVGEQTQHLIPTLIRAAYSGELVNLVTAPVHDYIDVEDLVDGILNLSSNQAKGIFELGTGIKTSNLEVFNLVEEITGKKIKMNTVNSMRDYDNENWVSTNFRARSFGWLPKKSLKLSIQEQVDAYKTTV